MTDTIKAVADAILRKVWNIAGCPTLVFAKLPPGISREHMEPSYKDAEEIAKLAIEAMSIREMTVEDVASYIVNSGDTQTYLMAKRVARELAKLGTIRIVEKKQ